MVDVNKSKTAIWVITPNGTKLAEMLSRDLTESDVYISRKIAPTQIGHLRFENLSETLESKI
jgi:hypothetical protein